MSNINLTINQAVNNAKILDHRGVVFASDKNGNLHHISNFNIFGRLFNFIRNLINGTTDHTVNKVVLATFQTINQYAKDHKDKPIWTYSLNPKGFDFDIGFDKVAMRVLSDYSRFNTYYYSSSEKKFDDTGIKIRKAAHEVMLMAIEERKKEGIDFDCDHLNERQY